MPGDQTIHSQTTCKAASYRSSTFYSRDLKECMPNGRIHQLAIATMALKYLAVPASSAPSELVFFSQLMLILDRKRWRIDADRKDFTLKQEP